MRTADKVVDSPKDLSIEGKRAREYEAGSERENRERQIEAYCKVHSNIAKVCERGMRICGIDVGKAAANSAYVPLLT